MKKGRPKEKFNLHIICVTGNLDGRDKHSQNRQETALKTPHACIQAAQHQVSARDIPKLWSHEKFMISTEFNDEISRHEVLL